MCGLVGLYTTLPQGFTSFDKDEFRSLLILDSLRGIDSTGCFGVSRFENNNIDIVKSIGSPYTLFQYDQNSKFSTRIVSEYSVVAGHNRFATYGEVNAINAHPFQEDNITLMHNGTISNFKALNKKYPDIRVDSQVVAKMFSTEGIEETIQQLYGAFAFVWFDSEDKSLNFLRNFERPLYLAKYQSNQMAWASENATLIWHGARHKYTLDIEELPTMRQFKFHMGEINPEITEIKYKTKTYSMPYNSTNYENDEDYYSSRVLSVKGKLTGISLALGDVINFELDDWTETSKEWHTITGYSKDFPEIVLTGAYKGPPEDLLDAELVSGTVSYISYIRANPPRTGVKWKVSLSNISPIEKKIEGQGDWIVLADDSHVRSFRFHQILKENNHKCGWCNTTIIVGAQYHNHAIFSHEVKDKPNVESILCSKCTDDFLCFPSEELE